MALRSQLIQIVAVAAVLALAQPASAGFIDIPLAWNGGADFTPAGLVVHHAFRNVCHLKSVDTYVCLEEPVGGCRWRADVRIIRSTNSGVRVHGEE
jgi:hypothetical protein